MYCALCEQRRGDIFNCSAVFSVVSCGDSTITFKGSTKRKMQVFKWAKKTNRINEKWYHLVFQMGKVKKKICRTFQVSSLQHTLDVWKSECINENRNDMSKNVHNVAHVRRILINDKMGTRLISEQTQTLSGILEKFLQEVSCFTF